MFRRNLPNSGMIRRALKNEKLSPLCRGNPETIEAIKLVARTEGILLDPVYTGKAMAALIDCIHRKAIESNETVLFLHTGGFPALFAYNKDFNLDEKLVKT